MEPLLEGLAKYERIMMNNEALAMAPDVNFNSITTIGGT
jgi:hypothetical protein